MINKVNRKFVNNRKVKCCIFCLKTDYKKPTQNRNYNQQKTTTTISNNKQYLKRNNGGQKSEVGGRKRDQ